MTDENEEEDFFSMLSKEETSTIQSAVAPSAKEEASTQAVYHNMASESDHDDHGEVQSKPPDPSAAGDDTVRFQEILAAFYSKHNFSNLDKVPYLAEKFNDRRWELWEQLSMKYQLSPPESRELWIRFNIGHDGISECARRVFTLTEAIRVPDDSMLLRKTAWRTVLGVNAEGSQRSLYEKYAAELAPREQVMKLRPESSDIVRDVQRTHQELAFFHEPSVLQSLTAILTVYTRLNGVPYVQGMNEILAMLFFVMRDESDAFWAFSAMMGQLNDLYTAEADTTQAGIYSQIDSLTDFLRCYDYELWKHLGQIDFPLTTLAMRWITTLLAMDLTLPDTMRLWDIMLQSSNSGHLLPFSVILSLSYLLSLSDDLFEFTDGQDAIEMASRFGKGVDVDISKIQIVSLSIYAFETILRGRYSPSSDEPVFDAILGVVGAAKDRVVESLGRTDIQIARDQVLDKVTTVKDTMSGWLGKMIASIPTPPAQDALSDESGPHAIVGTGKNPPVV